MRTRFYLLSALLILSLVLFGWAHTMVWAARDGVALEETVLEGDGAAAEGISVDLRTECLDHLLWDTRYVAGAEGTIHTDYTYAMNGYHYLWTVEPYGFSLDFWGNSGITREGENEDEYGMQKPFNDVASRCPLGTEDYTERIDLRDYYSEFPIFVQRAEIVSGDVSLYLPEGGNRVEQQLQQELRRCFPITVPEGTYMEIRVDKGEDGRSSGYGYSTPENVQMPETYSVVTEGGCYFTLSSSTPGGGAKLDTSRFVLGYGVYFLPVELTPAPEEIRNAWKADVMSVQTGAVERVYPIDPATDYAALYANADKSRLYLITQTDGACILTVLDAADGRQLDTLTLFEVAAAGDETPYLRDFIMRDGFLVPYLSDGRFAVVTGEGDDYGIALTGSFENIYNNNLYLSDSSSWRNLELPALDFDGERLVVADMLDYPTECSFFLAVYDKDGPVVLSRYSNSLDRNGDWRSNRCEPAGPVPLTVRLP